MREDEYEELIKTPILTVAQAGKYFKANDGCAKHLILDTKGDKQGTYLERIFEQTKLLFAQWHPKINRS